MARPRSAAASTPPSRAPASRSRSTRTKGSTESLAAATPKPPARRRKAAKPLTSREMVDRVVELVEKREQPRSTVGIELGPRGQAMPRVTIVTGEDPKRVDAAVQKACSVIDYIVSRYGIQLSSGTPNGGE